MQRHGQSRRIASLKHRPGTGLLADRTTDGHRRATRASLAAGARKCGTSIGVRAGSTRELVLLPRSEIARRSEAGITISPKPPRQMAYVKLGLEEEVLATEPVDQMPSLPGCLKDTERANGSLPAVPHQPRREIVVTMLINDLRIPPGITSAFRIASDKRRRPRCALVATDAISVSAHGRRSVRTSQGQSRCQTG